MSDIDLSKVQWDNVGMPQGVGQFGPGTKYTPNQMQQLNAARDALRAAEDRGASYTYNAIDPSQVQWDQPQPERPKPAQAKAAPNDEAQARRLFAANLPFSGGMLGPDIAMGARQVVDAGAQLLTRGLEKIPGISDYMRGQRESVESVNQRALDEYKRLYDPDGQPLAPVGRGVGQAIATAPVMAMRAATTLPRVMAQGAGMGGAVSALTPVYGAGDDFWQRKAEQGEEGALAGGLTAGAFGTAGRLISPNVRPEVKALMDEGVTPTPGQMAGGALKTAEEKLTSLPVLGDAIKSSQTKALNEYNIALYNRILRPIGEKYKGPAGQEGIAAVGDKLSAAYDDALAKSVPSEVTQTFRAQMNQLASMVPQAKQKDFANAVNGALKVTPGNTLTPSVAKDAESELGRLARQYSGSAVAEERELGRAFMQAQANLRALVAQSNPQMAPRIQAINKGWSDLVQLENAANSTKAARNAGLVTPADQLRGIKKSDYSVRDRRFARGEMPNQEFAQAADAVLSNKYPDSGSIGRLIMGGGLLGGGAAISPAVLSGASLATLPYLPGGRQAMAALFARRPAAAEPLGGLLKEMAPYLGAAAPAGLL